MAETHKSFGLFRVPEMLDLQLVDVPGGQRGFGFQRPRCPELLDIRSRLNITQYALLLVTTSTGGNRERPRHYQRRVFPQPVHQSRAMVTVQTSTLSREIPRRTANACRTPGYIMRCIIPVNGGSFEQTGTFVCMVHELLSMGRESILHSSLSRDKEKNK